MKSYLSLLSKRMLARFFLIIFLPGGYAIAAEKAPPWMTTLAEITRHPDPLQALARRAVRGAPKFSKPQCVTPAQPGLKYRKCWSEAVGGELFLHAVLEYELEESSESGAHGMLRVWLPKEPCTTVRQAEQVFESTFTKTLGGEPISGQFNTQMESYRSRLFGAEMQPLYLVVNTLSGCITTANLSR